MKTDFLRKTLNFFKKYFSFTFQEKNKLTFNLTLPFWTKHVEVPWVLEGIDVVPDLRCHGFDF